VAKKRRKQTRRTVERTEGLPPKLPPLDLKPDTDDEPWGDDGLTVRQRAFVEALVGPAGGNATKAAAMAGYNDNNRDALRVTASNLLNSPNVAEAISRAMARRRLTPEWIRESLAELASASMRNFVTVDLEGNLTVDWAKAVQAGAIGQVREIKEDVMEVDGVSTRVIKRSFKLHDVIRAKELLAKLHGLLKGDSVAPGHTDLFTADPALAGVELPPGAVPGVAPPGAVQDDPRGTAEREDGTVR
jgi:phage terminase small subunit